MKGIATQFQMDYGTKVSTSSLETIQVVIDPEVMVRPYASATLTEMHRMNPLKFETLDITEEELFWYFSELVRLRIRQVLNRKVPWRFMRTLHMPAWIEFSLTGIGEVILADQGLRFLPAENEAGDSVDQEKLAKISDILRSFERDGLAVVTNGFAPSINGDAEVMTLCILDGYVRGLDAKSHPVKTYVAAFLGQKIVQENAFKVLYRVRYDDVQFIAASLLHDPKVYGSV